MIEKSDRFKEELQDIVAYIAEDSVTRALQFYDEIILKIENLSASPYTYRKRKSLNDENIRELIHKGYTVPYYISIRQTAKL